MLGCHFPNASSGHGPGFRERSATFGASDNAGELISKESLVQDERKQSGRFGRKTSLNSMIMVGERESSGEGSKGRPRLLFPRERRNTIESEGERFRKSSFGSPNLSRLKNFSLSSMMGERKISLSIEEEEGGKKRERKSSLGSMGFFCGDKWGSCRSSRRGSVDCVGRSRQRKTSLSSLGGLFASRESKESSEEGFKVSRHRSLPTYGMSPSRSSRSVLADGSEGSLCSGGKSTSVREKRLWFSVQWPGLSVCLPEERPLRRALSDKGETGLTR